MRWSNCPLKGLCHYHAKRKRRTSLYSSLSQSRNELSNRQFFHITWDIISETKGSPVEERVVGRLLASAMIGGRPKSHIRSPQQTNVILSTSPLFLHNIRAPLNMIIRRKCPKRGGGGPQNNKRRHFYAQSHELLGGSIDHESSPICTCVRALLWKAATALKAVTRTFLWTGTAVPVYLLYKVACWEVAVSCELLCSAWLLQPDSMEVLLSEATHIQPHTATFINRNLTSSSSNKCCHTPIKVKGRRVVWRPQLAEAGEGQASQASKRESARERRQAKFYLHRSLSLGVRVVQQLCYVLFDGLLEVFPAVCVIGVMLGCENLSRARSRAPQFLTDTGIVRCEIFSCNFTTPNFVPGST